MSNSDIDYIEAELRATTSSGSKTTPWPPTKGHWANAYARLESLRTTPPPPPPTGTVLFDGRAARMNVLEESGSPPNVVQTQDPAGVWDGLDFTHGDISLQADPRYGKVYKVAVKTGDTNPWGGSDVIDGAAQLASRKPTHLGGWDWYGVAIRIDQWNGPVSDIRFMEVVSLGYQTSASSQVALGATADANGKQSWSIFQNAGYGDNPNGWAQGTVAYTSTFLPVTYGTWQEFAVGVLQSTGDDGQVQVYSRQPGQTWARAFAHSGATEFYGIASGNTFAIDASNWPTTLDKIGLYWGTHDNAIQQQGLLISGLTRCTDLATAQSTFPA